MSEPFNKASRAASLRAWDNGCDTLAAAMGIGHILREGNMDSYDRLRVIMSELELFMDDLKDAMEFLDEADE